MWRVYYEDGTTWSWPQGFDGMPTRGVIAILQKVDVNHNPRWHLVHGSQYYMRAQDEWLHAYENDVVDYLENDKPIDKLLVGRMTTKRIFSEIIEAAKNDKNAENL